MTAITGTGNTAILSMLQIKKPSAGAAPGSLTNSTGAQAVTPKYNPSFLFSINQQAQAKRAAATVPSNTPVASTAFSASASTVPTATKPAPTIPIGTTFTPSDPNAPSTPSSIASFLGNLL